MGAREVSLDPGAANHQQWVGGADCQDPEGLNSRSLASSLRQEQLWGWRVEGGYGGGQHLRHTAGDGSGQVAGHGRRRVRVAADSGRWGVVWATSWRPYRWGPVSWWWAPCWQPPWRPPVTISTRTGYRGIGSLEAMENKGGGGVGCAAMERWLRDVLSWHYKICV